MKQLTISITLLLVSIPFLATAADSEEPGLRVAINGFGRIGQTFLRTIFDDLQAEEKLKVVAINVGPSKHRDNAGHTFKYDTTMGTFSGTVRHEGDTLIVNDHIIKLLTITDPDKLDWTPHDIDWVVEASGKYTGKDSYRAHINAGAKHTLITAPCDVEDVPTIVLGVNNNRFNLKKDEIVSLASCTTNALAPMLKVLHETFGIEQGFMTTIHAYTSSQSLVDAERGDPRLSRAAALNIIPTKTGAERMIDQVMPEIKGRIKASSVRVPVSVVSLIKLVISTTKEMNKKEINSAFQKAEEGNLKGILSTGSEPLVSSDYKGDGSSVVVDTLLTQAAGRMSEVSGWYDNEWGYSMRLKDFLMKVAEQSVVSIEKGIWRDAHWAPLIACNL